MQQIESFRGLKASIWPQPEKATVKLEFEVPRRVTLGNVLLGGFYIWVGVQILRA